MKFPVLFFDLDGTLTDSSKGICRCARYALEKGGYPVEPEEAYLSWIGPPLEESFQERIGVSPAEAGRLVAFYRERYSRVGLFENRVYDGIPPLLQELKAAGARMAVATGKPTAFSRRILAEFHLLEYFETVSGIPLSGAPLSKHRVIEAAMAQMALPHRDRCLMIGDRRHDAEGAQLSGIPCAYVLYGFGSRTEAEASGAEYVLKTVDDLRAFLLP